MTYKNFFFLVCLFFPSLLFGQKWKSYELSLRGDTINRMDKKGLKQGMWVISTESKYGNEGLKQIGEYYDNKKFGSWRTYGSDNVLLVEENFKNDYLDGNVKYYEDGYLVCIGKYLALRTDQALDTILVENPETDILEERVIKTSLGSVKHGLWTFYRYPGTEIERIREYQIDEIVYEKEYPLVIDSSMIKQKQSALPHKSDNPPPGVWRKNNDNNKKPSRYTDFKENEPFIVPNVRKKK